MVFIFNAYVMLFLIMPFIVLFWLIRPSYFPFMQTTNNLVSRLKIFGFCVLAFIVSLVVLALLMPSDTAIESNSALGIITGLLISVVMIWLSIKQGKSVKQPATAKAVNEQRLNTIQAEALKPADLEQPITAQTKGLIAQESHNEPDLIETKKKRSFFEQRQVKSDVYQRLIQMASDGEITTAEQAQIREMLIDADLTEKQQLKAFVQAFKAAYQHIIADNIVTENEHQSLIRIQQLFNIPSANLSKELKALDKHKILRQIQNGVFPSCQSNIILKKDEVAYFNYSADLIEERVVRGRYQGGSAAVNFRVAKGVSFRLGQSRGRFKSEKEPLAVSSGRLIVTNQRIVFDGDKKSFNIAIGKLLGYEVFSDSVLIKPERGNPKLLKLSDRSYDADILDVGINQIVYN